MFRLERFKGSCLWQLDPRPSQAFWGQSVRGSAVLPMLLFYVLVPRPLGRLPVLSNFGRGYWINLIET